MYQNSFSSHFGKRYQIPHAFCLFIVCVYFVVCVGLNVVEVKHDNQPVVKKYVADDLNSYDTWNGK